jgi:hypothetical protein
METTWRLEILSTLVYTGDSIEDIEFTLTDEELDVEFDGGYGGSEGKHFTGWSKDWVYFPVVYDGSEWVGYAPRNPNGKATRHQGGE